MGASDGSRLVRGSGAPRMARCTRWQELGADVIALARIAEALAAGSDGRLGRCDGHHVQLLPLSQARFPRGHLPPTRPFDISLSTPLDIAKQRKALQSNITQCNATQSNAKQREAMQNNTRRH